MEFSSRFLNRKNLIHLAFMALLAFLIFRLWILNDGFVIYRDLYWPYVPGDYFVHTSYFNPYLVSNTQSVDVSSFTRMVITWPIPLLMSLGVESSRVELIYYLFGFVVCYVSFLFAIRRVLGFMKINQVPILAELIPMLFLMINPFSLQMMIFIFIWMAIGLLAALAGVLLSVAFDDNYRIMSKDTLIAMVLFVLLIFIEIRFVFYALIVVLLVAILMFLMAKNRIKRMIKLVPIFLFFIIAVSVTITITNEAQTQPAQVIAEPSTTPAINFDDIAYFSMSQPWNLYNVLQLQGYYWSTIEYTKLPFLSAGVLTVMNFLVPALAMCSLALCRSKKEKIGVLLLISITIAGILFSTGVKPPGTPVAELMLAFASTGLPLSEAFVRNLLFPYYSMILVSIGYSLLLAFVLAKTLPKMASPRECRCWKSPKLKRLPSIPHKDWIVAGIIAAVIILANAQALSGDLGPSGAISNVNLASEDKAGVLEPYHPV
jgi:hypothetical protein